MNKKNQLEKLYEEQTKILRPIFNILNESGKVFQFVGGTAINRLLFKNPYRFSKDIDLYIQGCDNFNYLEDVFGGTEHLKKLKKLLKDLDTEFISEGHPAGYTILKNDIITTHLQDDFFIEYQVECDYNSQVVWYKDFQLDLQVNSLSICDFLNNKLIKIRDRIKEDRVDELNKDLVDIYMLLSVYQDFNNESIDLKNEILKFEDVLRNHFKESFEEESKKYLFDMEIIPNSFDELFEVIKRME